MENFQGMAAATLHPGNSSMQRKERIQFFLIWLFLGVVPLFLRPLWETDEARYAEIPREMLATGDWLTPRLNQVLYFEKPPLQYWISAISMKIFGLNAMAARLPLALATLILLWSAYRLSRRLGAPQPMRAAFMAGTTLLAYIGHQTLSLDALFSALLLLSLVASIEVVRGRFEGRHALGWTLLAFGANALAFMIKGPAAPVLLGGILLLTIPFAWGIPAIRKAALRLLWDPLGWLIFAAIVTPWFVIVQRVNPDHARFFFIHENFLRYTTTIHSRQGSSNPVLAKLYFVEILLVGLLPWLTTSVVGLKRAVGFLGRKEGTTQPEQAMLHRWTVAALVLAFAIPFVFFSFSDSQLPLYILPVVVPLLSLSCAFEREGEFCTVLKHSGWELLVLGAIFTIACPFLLKDDGSLVWTMAVGIAFLGLGLWTLQSKQVVRSQWMGLLIACLLLLTIASQKAVGPGKSVANLVRQAPRNAQWISCGNYFQGIPFYTRSRVVVVAGTGELSFGVDHLSSWERDRWFPENPDALGEVASKMKIEDPSRPVWALVATSTWKDLSEKQRQVWEVINQSHSAHLVRLK